MAAMKTSRTSYLLHVWDGVHDRLHVRANQRFGGKVISWLCQVVNSWPARHAEHDSHRQSQLIWSTTARLGSALRTSSTCTLLLCNLSTSIWTRTLPVTRTLKLYLICRCEISAASIPRALVKSQTTYLRYIVCRKWRKICEIAATQEMSKMSWVRLTWKIADKLLY